MKEYYRNDLKKLYAFLIPKKIRLLVIKHSGQEARGKFDYILLDSVVGDMPDVQQELLNFHRFCKPDTKLVVTYYNRLWEPILRLASFLGWRRVHHEQNWLDEKDLANLLDLADFEMVNFGKRLLLPIQLLFISDLINRWLAPLPLINSLCLTTWVVARPKAKKRKDYSVSIIVPARNEAGNVPKVTAAIPRFGKWQEIIFVEGHSHDNTWKEIKKQILTGGKRRFNIRAYKQRGKGKADAVRLGFSKAKGEILIILDADLTVNPKDLSKFYEVLASGKGEFVNGSRMIYPMEKQAMRILNVFGNKIFSWLFTWILGQRFKDTLCGTKALLKTDYRKIANNRKFFGNFDPFGDYDLIFGAVKQNLKVVELPIRYRERTYGSTNISRFTHGWLLLKMTWFAFRKFRVGKTMI